jgi:beta-phosphoglucomutase-like phosphatase (HAD superfamily)
MNALAPIKGIVFDCDGTLVDSEHAANHALIMLLHKYGLSQYSLQHAYEFFVGRTLYDIFSELEAKHGIEFPDDVIDRLIDIRMEQDELYIQPIQGVKDSLPRLASWYPLAVASNGERANVLRSLKLANILGHFDKSKIFTPADVGGKGKPAPDIYLHAAKALKLQPKQVLAIEDSPVGVKAAVAAGCKVWGFCAVAKSPEPAQALWDAGADAVFDTIRELTEAALDERATA